MIEGLNSSTYFLCSWNCFKYFGFEILPFISNRALIELTYFSLCSFFSSSRTCKTQCTVSCHYKKSTSDSNFKERTLCGCSILAVKDMIFRNSFLKTCIYLQTYAQSHRRRGSQNEIVCIKQLLWKILLLFLCGPNIQCYAMNQKGCIKQQKVVSCKYLILVNTFYSILSTTAISMNTKLTSPFLVWCSFRPRGYSIQCVIFRNQIQLHGELFTF